MQPLNVKENFMLYDTVGVYEPTGQNITNPPGWFTTYGAMGGAPEVNFFNVRNRRVGLPYCNLDSIDSMSYAFRVRSLGITFFANNMTQAPSWATDDTFSPEDITGHVFTVDLPRHTGFRFRVQQDDVLFGHVLLAPAGYGPCGDGFGRGSPSLNQNANFANGFDHHLSAFTQGIPEYTARWPFAKPIDIPRDASINIKLTFSEWARNLLAAMPYDLEFQGINDGVDDIVSNRVFAGIQVSLIGERLVQQRGEHHR
jgi:hypothetical protein